MTASQSSSTLDSLQTSSNLSLGSNFSGRVLGDPAAAHLEMDSNAQESETERQDKTVVEITQAAGNPHD